MRDSLAHSRKYKIIFSRLCKCEIDIFATREILFIAENGSLKMILKKAHHCVIQKRKKLK